MLVPGPHLINGLLDMIDNYPAIGMARLGLAASILLASALGIVVGVELALPADMVADKGATAHTLNVFSDMLLAGIVTCGFAVFYNTPWPQVAMAVLGGVAGHGIRFLAMRGGLTLELATLLGALAVGIVSAWMARSNRTPIAVIAFAGAVTMMPGVQMYRALSGVLQLARFKDSTDLPTIGGTVGDAAQSCLVVAALTLGLVVGAKAVMAVAGASRSKAISVAAANPAVTSADNVYQSRFAPELADPPPESVHHDKS
jgi:uncharacterized membrane protein YjjB (DUF3815 family)